MGDGGSISASSARSTPRASSANRNQEQLPRMGQGECSRRALLCLSGAWCVPALGHGVPREQKGSRAWPGLSHCG